MILDSLSNSSAYRRLGERFAAGFDYLRTTDLAAIPAGRYKIRGEQIVAIVESYETKPVEKGRWEAHQQNVDIQYVISGRERMGLASIERMKSLAPYDAEKDVEFFDGDGQFVLVERGSFALFLPQDVHMPGLAVGPGERVKKVVVKVRLG